MTELWHGAGGLIVGSLIAAGATVAAAVPSTILVYRAVTGSTASSANRIAAEKQIRGLQATVTTLEEQLTQAQSAQAPTAPANPVSTSRAQPNVAASVPIPVPKATTPPVLTPAPLPDTKSGVVLASNQAWHQNG